jgi:CBS domain-containing protein
MNRQHIRRIPVVEDDKVVGIVYISDLFFHLVDKII